MFLQVVFAITTNLGDKMKLVDFYRINNIQEHHKKTAIGSWISPLDKSSKKLLAIHKNNCLLLMNQNFHTNRIRNDLMGIRYNVKLLRVSYAFITD